jgi:hypothetical protein
MTVLAALAHEVGHIWWNDLFKDPNSNNYSFDKFCNKKFFYSWKQHITPPARPWRYFGDLDGRNEHETDTATDNVSQTELNSAINNSSAANSILKRIYAKKGRWASVLAAFSPDEDFVETFEYVVMTGAAPGYSLRSLALGVAGSPGSIGDIPSDGPSKPHLGKKVDCICKEVPGGCPAG